MAPPRRVLAALLLGAAAPAAAFQPARVSSQHRHSVAVCSTIDNRRRRSRSDNEASEGLGIVNVPVTEDAIKMAKDKLAASADRLLRDGLPRGGFAADLFLTSGA